MHVAGIEAMSSSARDDAEATGLPAFSVDDHIGWLPGWEQRDAAEQRVLGAAIAAQDRRVLDSGVPSGNGPDCG